MLKIRFCVFLAALFPLTFVGAVQADRGERGEGATTARQGVVRCGGSNFLNLGGTEIHTATYDLRNFDSANPIVIDRLRIFDATGAVLRDSANSALPPSDNGILGPANNTLNPNQTATYSTANLVPFQGPTTHALQMEIEWSARRGAALSLDVITVRIVRARDPDTGAGLAERARHAIECRSILLK